MRSPFGTLRTKTAIVLLVLGSMLAPPPASAHYANSCDHGVNCPPAHLSLSVTTNSQYVSNPSGLTFRLGQTDHTDPAIDVQYLIPNGWQFGFSGVPQGVGPSGPAATCDSTFTDSTLYTYLDNLPGGIRNGNTVMSLTDSAQAMTDTVRSPSTSNTAPIFFGNPNGVQSPYIQASYGFLTFLNYDGTTANLCLYLYAKDYRADHSDNTQDPCNYRGTGASAVPQAAVVAKPNDPNCERGREFLIPITMSRLDPADPLSSTFGWRMHFDFGQIYRDPYLASDNITLINAMLNIDSYWYVNMWTKTNPNSAQLEKVVLSRTPSTPGDYEFRALISTCANGVAPPQSPLPGNGKSVDNPCNGGTLATPYTLSSTISIRSAPSSGTYYPIAALQGPATTNVPAPFGVIIGQQSATVPWTPPVVPNGESVKGYVLAIAYPGIQSSLHFEYMVTNPADGGFDPRQPCGPTGLGIGDTNPTCSLSLNFPLQTVSGGSLPADGVYDLALITVYDDGRRTDGLCDDGTGPGVKCPVDMPAILTDGRGVSIRHLLIRSAAWPNAFGQFFTGQIEGGSSGTIGAYVLLVNFATHHAQMIAWNPPPPCGTLSTAATTLKECLPLVQKSPAYDATSTAIMGASAQSGTVIFSSSQVSGSGQEFAFAGVAQPSEADGIFAIWDTKNMNPDPNAILAGHGVAGQPNGALQQFQGKRIG